jgi:hypothetical protein
LPSKIGGGGDLAIAMVLELEVLTKECSLEISIALSEIQAHLIITIPATKKNYKSK